MSAAPTEQYGLVSVILPTYNRARTLARAIRSVLGQTYENLELIVVDDGSTDDTDVVMAQFNDKRVHYHRMPENRGASAARNVGLRMAIGEFIAFQDSDDEWLVDKLEHQIEAARGLNHDLVAVIHYKIIYGRDEKRIYGPGRICCVPIIDVPDGSRDFEKLTHKGNLMSPQALMFSKRALGLTGMFDELLVNSVDWDFALRLVRHVKVAFVEVPLVISYIQPDSISRIRRGAAISQLRIALKLRRRPEVDAAVLSGHLGRVGMMITRLGKPRLGARLLYRAIVLQPTSWNNWGRLAATVLGSASYVRKARSARRESGSELTALAQV